MIIIEELAYSLHLGSDKNRKNISRLNSKNNISKTTSLSNNAIQNANQLSRVDKHNYRKYDNDTEDVYIVKGTSSVYEDVKELYLKEFEGSRIEYNSKQNRPCRMIDNYFENVSNNEKKDLACEIIIELGDKNYWDTKDIEFKKKMGNVYYKQVKDLEMLIPNFKVASAIIHYDETSPHMHIVGIPIKDKLKNGMEKQVGKSDVFTKESLKILQDRMRTLCIDEFNKIYKLDHYIKKKQKGRNKDINVKDMDDYENIKKELEISKNSIDTFNKKLEIVKKDIQESEEIFNNLERSKFNHYTISNRDKDKLEKFIKDTKVSNEEYENLINISYSLDSINSNLKYQQNLNKELRDRNNALVIRINAKDKENVDYKTTEEFHKSIIKTYKDEKLDLIQFISEKIHTKNKQYEAVAKDFYSKGIFNKDEYKLSLKPLFNLSKAEISAALNKINQEMDESAEEFYKDNKKDDYYL